MIRIWLVCAYIIHCVFKRVAPWRYFLLNASYFNDDKGVFSKLDIDQAIPLSWRLSQTLDHAGAEPQHFPVFLKPEWGQNAFGIYRADDLKSLQQLRATLHPEAKYILQEAAPGQREFEIFMINAQVEGQEPLMLSITETCNIQHAEYPINGIYNPGTFYVDINARFSHEQRQQLSDYFSQIGQFRIARLCAKADSEADLLAGHFKVVEINLFLPMPLVLLCNNVPAKQKLILGWKVSRALASATQFLPTTTVKKSIFFRTLQINQRYHSPWHALHKVLKHFRQV